MSTRQNKILMMIAVVFVFSLFSLPGVFAASLAEVPSTAPRSVMEFMDPRTVEHTYFLDRRVTTPKKHTANPVIAECHSAQTVLKGKDGRLKMWYLTRRRRPGYTGSARDYTLRYAESDDGITWDLPMLGLKEFDGNKNNNVVLTVNDTDMNGAPIGDGEGIWNFCVIDNDQTPSPHVRGRYTALIGEGDFAWSDDGLNWTVYPENPVFSANHSDTFNNFIFDPSIGRYVLFYRPGVWLRAGCWRQANRLVARIESDDLIHWDKSSARCVLDTDARDAPAFSEAGGARGRDLQFYGMTVTPYQDFYIGMAFLLNEVTGEMDVRLVHSFDGIDWRREPDEQPFIETDPDAWDCGFIGFVSAGSPVSMGDDLYIYYSAFNFTHSYVFPSEDKTPRMGLGLVVVKQGRLVGYHAGPAKGELLTRPFVLDGAQLMLNADAVNGEVRAALFSEDGVPIPGYSIKESAPVREDGLNIPLRWNGKTNLFDLVGKKVRLRLTATDAALYAVSTGDYTPSPAIIGTKDSADFTWKYDFTNDFPNVSDLDANGIGDFNELIKTGASITMSDGQLHFTTINGSGAHYYAGWGAGSKLWDVIYDLDYEHGVTVEISVKVLAAAEGTRGATGLGMMPNGTEIDGKLTIAKTIQYWEVASGVSSIFQPLGTNTYDNTDGFHAFRIALHPDTETYSVWRDSELLASGLGDSDARDGLRRLVFGNYADSLLKGDVDVEYIRFTSGFYAAPIPPIDKVKATCVSLARERF